METTHSDHTAPAELLARNIYKLSLGSAEREEEGRGLGEGAWRKRKGAGTERERGDAVWLEKGKNLLEKTLWPWPL